MCGGAGVIQGQAPSLVSCCPACGGKGFVEMTNEEWLKSLDTEGLVDYLYEVHKGGNSVERQRWIENHKERVKMQFRGWLKEIHDEM
jgi:hypothetical protein